MIPTSNGGLSRKGRWAKGYAEVMHIPVFPLGDRTKLPRAKSHGHLDATCDLAAVEAWWTKYPDANIAARCTVFFVFDIDPRNGGDETLRVLINEHGALPDTLQQTTARKGTQYFFLQPDQREVTGCTNLYPGIDVKGSKGYVVLPPSETPNGQYIWDGAAPPQDQPILPAPEWLLAAIFERQRSDEDAPASDSGGSDTLELAAMISKAMPPEGERHDVFLAISGFLARRRCPIEQTRELVRGIYKIVWKTLAQFPLADQEIKSSYERVARGEKVTGWYTLKDVLPKNVLQALGDWAQFHHDEEIAETAAEATPEQHLAFVNGDRMLAQRAIEFTYGIQRVGEGLEADVWVGAEQSKLKWPSIADLLKLEKTREAVATCLGITLIPTRESQSDWQHVAHSILQLAKGERLSKADALRAEVQNLAATAIRQSYEKAILKEDLGLLWEGLKAYTPCDSVLDSHGRVTMIDFPQCVYLYGSTIHIYAPCLHAIQKLRRVQGRLTLREVTEGLHSAGFLHQHVEVWTGDVRKRCWLWIGAQTALSPYWEMDNLSVDEAAVVL